MTDIPIPPEEMRQLVGGLPPEFYDNPSGDLVLPGTCEEDYRAVLDFGCGCGRIARQLLQHRPRPGRYLGIDLHRGMIDWCRANLKPLDPGFDFIHHDVFSAGLNPGADKPPVLPFPVADDEFTLVNAMSVFTHLIEASARHYLREVGRVMVHGGLLHSTWFLFDKRDFPMMQSFQNALYINDLDLSNAVIFDRAWLKREAYEAGLQIVDATPPAIRGFHWTIRMVRDLSRTPAELPEDAARLGSAPPPPMPARAEAIGRDDA